MSGVAGGVWGRVFSEYGMLVVLLVLCGFFSAVSLAEQHPTGEAAARQLAGMIPAEFGSGASVLVVARDTTDDAAFVGELRRRLEEGGVRIAGVVRGEPIDARRELARIGDAGERLDVIACTRTTAAWGVFERLPQQFPSLAGARVVKPESYRWPTFLNADNLLNITNQIAVIAIIAIGMTLVIISGGIDLSVGSLVALSAVVTALLIRDFGGAEQASTLAMVLCGLGGIAACSASGVFSGAMVALFRVPPFIVTLAMMLIASGLAWIAADGQSISAVPDRLGWLDHGTTLGVSNPLLLMLLLYAAAHVLMTRMAVGRYVYAVGGNREAARLSGVPVRRVTVFVYAVTGALAGLAGLIMASRFTSGDPKYGEMYELTVIAAVVVGGTSLSGGEGKILGTLVGALIIAVIQNGMNLLEIKSYTQKVVFGAVILGAVLIDRLKHRGNP